MSAPAIDPIVIPGTPEAPAPAPPTPDPPSPPAAEPPASPPPVATPPSSPPPSPPPAASPPPAQEPAPAPPPPVAAPSPSPPTQSPPPPPQPPAQAPPPQQQPTQQRPPANSPPTAAPATRAPPQAASPPQTQAQSPPPAQQQDVAQASTPVAAPAPVVVASPTQSGFQVVATTPRQALISTPVNRPGPANPLPSSSPSLEADIANASNGDNNEGSGPNAAAIAVPVVLILLALIAAGLFYGRKYLRTKQERRHTVLVDQAFGNEYSGNGEKRTMSEAWDGARPSMLKEKEVDRPLDQVEEEDDTINAAGYGVVPPPPVSPLSPYGADPFQRQLPHHHQSGAEVLASPPAASDLETFETAQTYHTFRPAGAQVDSLYGGVADSSVTAQGGGPVRQSVGGYSTYSNDSWRSGPAVQGRASTNGFLSVDDARDSVIDTYSASPPAPKIAIVGASEADDESIHARTRPVSEANTVGTRKSLRWSSYMPWSGQAM